MLKANLLFVITKLELGGAQKSLLDLVSGLDRDSFTIYIYTAASGELMDEALGLGVADVYRSRFLERRINPFKDLSALIELRDFIKKKRIDIVHTHSSKAGIIGRIAARLAGVKAVVHTVHGWSFNDRQGPLARGVYVALEKIAAHCCRRIIVVSEHDRAQGIQRGIGASNLYSRIGYGIERHKFRREKRRAAESGTGVVVGTVACLKPQKAPQDFIRMASLVCRERPDTRFVVIGGGELRPGVERLIARYGLEDNVKLLGWRRDIPGLLATFDIFCLTSLWEGLPIAVIEAMAASLPVVCTDTGGVNELITNGRDGFIVARDDTAAIAGQVLGLLGDPSLRERIGAAAAARIDEGFSTASMVQATAQLYRDLLEEHKNEGGS